MYNPENDLITTFFQVNKTKTVKTKQIIHDNQDYDMNYIVDKKTGLKQFSIKYEGLKYLYTLSNKGEQINVEVFIPHKATAVGTMSGAIKPGNRLDLLSFEARETFGRNQAFFEDRAIENLKLIFDYLYQQS
ncbi:hypothetical protein ESZ54_11085 [Vagococcus silagei]|uniref:Uncharacterized protein n=1 Tax=Vagococcus silagei TaxID=2508885 RepID=A0A4S3B1K8_9ENTE|nr:hypothetical protein ESZ54_11085 [Vagococcus silagei]